ncbi:hypothetical protein AAFC00_005140 [Neodothiora populina]|uniref:Laccase n=1 Tax=Neodothiora populina TaxID=2781224 RepID=A0ABR3PL02_9PEZI
MAPIYLNLLAGILGTISSAVHNFPDLTSISGHSHSDIGSNLSNLGTELAAHLPPFLTDNPFSGGFPWGKKSSRNTNYHTDYPRTGIVRTYDWTVTKQDIAPDGVNVTGLLVNGQFPGPMIEANWGDTIRVTLHNELDEGTALHWHGFLQKGTQSFDGVPGISLCPIAPGKSFTYTFTAELYGTSWWHSHYSSQYASGMSGPIVIYGPQNAKYDIDLSPISGTDWYHTYYMDLVEGLSQPIPNTRIPYSQNVLINGKNNYDCSKTELGCIEDAGLATFNLTSGKKHHLRR